MSEAIAIREPEPPMAALASKNPFEMHGIDHLSASTLNAWVAQPALWVIERLMKMRAPMNCAVHRGSAIEAGVTEGLLDPDKPVAECQDAAMAVYNRLTALSSDPNRTKEGEAVAPSVAVALKELRQYGVPNMIQTRIEKIMEDVPVPLIGYLDYGFSNHGIIVDLKTSLRLASEISTAHARQVAGYVSGTNFTGRVAYTTPKKIGVYALANPEQHMEAMRQIALRLGRFLALSNDPQELAGLLTPDYDHWYWSNPIVRANGREVYGF